MSCPATPDGSLIHGCAALLAVGCLAVTLVGGLQERPTALAFGLLVTVGELHRWTGARVREAAPLGAAGALSYALLGADAGQPTHHGVAQVVAVVLAAALLGSVPHIARGRGPVLDHLARRVLTVAFAAACFQPLYNRGTFGQWSGPAYALLLLAILALTALCDAVLAAALAHSRTRWPFGPLLRDELHAAARHRLGRLRHGRGDGARGRRRRAVGAARVLAAAAADPAVPPPVRRRAGHLPADHHLPRPGHRDRRVHARRARPPRRRAQPGRRAGPGAHPARARPFWSTPP